MKKTRKILGKRVELGSKTPDRPGFQVTGTCALTASTNFEEILNRVIWKLIPARLKNFGIPYHLFSVKTNQLTIVSPLN